MLACGRSCSVTDAVHALDLYSGHSRHAALTVLPVQVLYDQALTEPDTLVRGCMMESY